MYARAASSSQPATHTNSSPTPMMVLYSPPTNCTMVTRWDGMVAVVGHLEHVGEVCRLDDEGVEGPGHHEGGVGGGEGGEDSGVRESSTSIVTSTRLRPYRSDTTPHVSTPATMPAK